MKTKTYRAANLQEALALIRRDLGPDACVLHTREAPRDWNAWWRGQRQIEVTAGLHVNVPSRLPAGSRAPHAQAPKAASAARATREALVGQDAPPPPIPPPRPVGDLGPARSWDARPPKNDHAWDHEPDDLRARVTRLQALVDALCRRETSSDARRAAPPDLPGAWAELHARLVAQEVPRDLADALVGDARERVSLSSGAEVPREALRGEVGKVLGRAAGIDLAPNQRRVVALVGPTGVGKTTTLAKLAARFRVRQRRKVALVTTDTQRVASAERLRSFAELLDVPLAAAATPRQLRDALDQFAEADLIFIDTAGVGPRDETGLEELRGLLAEACPHEVHLVLSVVAPARALLAAAERFAPVGVTSLLWTKLDEAPHFGQVLAVTRQRPWPLSYCAFGQNVPDDLEPAERGRLVDCLLASAPDDAAHHAAPDAATDAVGDAARDAVADRVGVFPGVLNAVVPAANSAGPIKPRALAAAPSQDR